MRTLRLLLVFALLSASSAAAQTASSAGRSASSGITVVGRGTAAALPDRARITVQIFNTAGGGSSPATSISDAADALRNALRTSGIADVREVLPIGTFGVRSAFPVIVGTLAKPTRERLETIARDVVKALPERLAPAYANAQIQVSLLVDDCGPDETRAERAAFADARNRAERAAVAAGLHVGGVTAIVNTQSFVPPGCLSKPDALEAPAGGPQYASLYGPLVVPITVNETVTFAVAGAS